MILSAGSPSKHEIVSCEPRDFGNELWWFQYSTWIETIDKSISEKKTSVNLNKRNIRYKLFNSNPPESLFFHKHNGILPISIWTFERYDYKLNISHHVNMINIYVSIVYNKWQIYRISMLYSGKYFIISAFIDWNMNINIINILHSTKFQKCFVYII